MLDAIELSKKLVSELRELAKSLNVSSYDTLKKDDLIQKILEVEPLNENSSIVNSKGNILLTKPKRKRKIAEQVLFIKSKPLTDEVIPSELMVEDDDIIVEVPFIKQNESVDATIEQKSEESNELVVTNYDVVKDDKIPSEQVVDEKEILNSDNTEIKNDNNQLIKNIWLSKIKQL